MSLTQIKQFTPPSNPSIDISFGENIHAEAVYSFDSDSCGPDLIALMAPVGKNGSMINIMDDLHPETVYKARVALRDDLTEAAEDAETEHRINSLGWS